jgi:DNA topoisomerase-1
MAAAQKLYEGGHITYMRTDNAMLSAEAAAAIRAYVTEKHGAEFVGMAGQHTMGTTAVEEAVVEEGAAGAAGAAAAAPKKGKKVKKSAAAATAAATATAPAPQAAHEAIRPTHVDLSEVDVSDPAQKTIYKLIWRRAIQSQMAASQTDVRKASIALAAEPDRVWNAEQSKLRFAGWKVLDSKDPASMKVEAEVWEEWAPHLVEGATLHWTTLQADEVFSKPKGRFTEASLIAELEKRGIGRPSTFASLVSTIVDREYVEKTNVEGKAQDSHHLMLKPRKWPPTLTTQSHKVGAEKNKLRSTALGRSVSDFLGREYSDLFNYDFTATMEQDLDIISRGEKPWKSLLQTTWDLYKERYAAQTTGGSAVAKAARERILADGLKVILSRKGPLYVKDPPAGSPKSVKATFAPLLAGTTYESATAEEAEAAFTAATLAKEGDLVGKLGDDEIRKKKGPYGFYAECKGVRVPLNGSEPLERIREKLTAKISFSTSEDGGTPYERKVGDYTIKKGPYGLYMYKHTLKRVNFVKFPTGVDPEKVNAADCAAAYSVGLNRKKRGGGGAAAAKKTTTDD